jgi:hypothetical protein
VPGASSGDGRGFVAPVRPELSRGWTAGTSTTWTAAVAGRERKLLWRLGVIGVEVEPDPFGVQIQIRNQDVSVERLRAN